jgi:hypothetical protein
MICAIICAIFTLVAYNGTPWVAFFACIFFLAGNVESLWFLFKCEDVDFKLRFISNVIAASILGACVFSLFRIFYNWLGPGATASSASTLSAIRMARDEFSRRAEMLFHLQGR